MRYYKNSETTLSEDDSSQPKEIRFTDCFTATETALLVDGGAETKSYPIGAHSVDMAQVTEGRWLYIKADKELLFSLSGGPAITLIENKATEMWVKFTSLDITLTDVTRVTIGIAGE